MNTSFAFWHYHYIAIVAAFLLTGCSNQTETEFKSVSELPFEKITLQNLENFERDTGDWSITGGVQSDFTKQASAKGLEGSGVLSYDHNGNSGRLSTNLTHRDLEFQAEFLQSGGAQADILLQGRYNVLERLREEFEEAFLAPGLWQNIHLLYRAPKFDNSGSVEEPARIEWLYLNGKLMIEDVAMDDASSENLNQPQPMILEGADGPVAFKNITYKRYEDNPPVKLQNISYEVFDYTGQDLPDFDTLKALKSGTADSLNVSVHSPQDEYFAMTYRGDLVIPQTGEYLFEIKASEKAELVIDGKKVIPDNNDVDSDALGAIVHLEKGKHSFSIPYYQEKWSNYIQLMYEGPQREKQPLASRTVGGYGQATREIMITMENTEKPERVGSFAMYNDEKRTHVVSVGSPSRVHYSYDLRRATLLNMWKGPFADVTKMWFNRGLDQLLVPLNVLVSGTAGIPVATLNSDDTFSNHALPNKLKREKYTIDEEGYPGFTYFYDDVLKFTDNLFPSEEGERLIRRLVFTADSMPEQTVARLAQAKQIELLDNGYYRINGKYYIGFDETVGQSVDIIESPDGLKALVVNLPEKQNKTTIQLHYIW